MGAIVFALFLSAALAQQIAAPPPEERLNGLTVILDQITAALSRRGLSDEELKRLRTQVIGAEAEAGAIALANDPVVGNLRTRLDQLKPETAAPELEIPAERQITVSCRFIDWSRLAAFARRCRNL